MLRKSFSILMAISISIVLIMQSGAAVHAQEPHPSIDSTLSVIESTRQELVLKLEVPSYILGQSVSNIGPCQTINIEGWGLSGEAGEPALPVKGTLVGLPSGATLQVSVLETGPVTVLNGIDLCPPSSLLQSGNPQGILNNLGEQRIVNQSAYAMNCDFPVDLVKIGSTAMIRSQPVARVLFQPFHYNPITRRLTYFSHMNVRVNFGTGVNLLPTSTFVDEGPYESILRSQVINYETARSWRYHAIPTPAPVTPLSALQPTYKLFVTRDGMVRVTYEDLQAAGLPVDIIDPSTFQLVNKANEVAIVVQGEGDGDFNSGDYILFYGEKINTRFTDTNIYWLTWGSSIGLRMDIVDGTPGSASIPINFISTVHLEENKSYQPANPSGPDHNHWYWELINPPGTASKTYTITLTDINTSATTAHLRGFLRGYAGDPQHHVHISINNNLVVQDFWTAQGEHSFDVEIPASYLLEGANSIKVECPLTDDIVVNQVLTDWFEVDYSKNYMADGTQTRFSGDNAGEWKYQVTGFNSNDQQVWDITDPVHPKQIAGTILVPSGSTFDLVFQQNIIAKHQYIAAVPGNISTPASISLALATDLHDSTNGADYIIIAHPNFLNAIQPLIDTYIAKGFRVKVVNVFDLYDEFNYGIYDPQAIQNFLAYAYASWARPAPSYVLLVGNGNYDFKNYLHGNIPNYIPPYLADVDPWMGETAADNRYVTISGDDILPDMALGRLPVQTEAEASAIVAKVIDYTQHESEDWAKKVLFTAGINDPTAGDFAALSDEVISKYLTPRGIPVDTMYYGITQTNGPDARQVVIDTINAGRGVVHFAGHSNPYSWIGDLNVADLSTTVLLNKADVQALTNTGKYSIFISMTCYTGYYVYPGIVTLDEALIRAENKGAVATWSPTGQGIAGGHDLLDRGFFEARYQNRVSSLGAATNQAKYYLYANSDSHYELIDTYILFGDPALSLPTYLYSFLPLILTN